MQIGAVLRQLRKIVGREAVLDRAEDVMLYEYDGGQSKGTPGVVVFPHTTEQVAQIVRLARRAGVSLTARGAGTGLSGGSISRDGGIVLGFARMNRILQVDATNQRVVVEPGVVNSELSAAVARYGLYFAPDPSSQKASTIGGNVAENSGGPHTLAYGVTVNHVTGLEVVLADGRVAQFGGKAGDAPGYDLTGFMVGTEGTVGIVTKITVKLTRVKEAVATLLGIFNTVDDAANTIVALTAAGITPAALEMLEGWTLATIEAAAHAGYPLDAAAVLLIEVDGLREEVQELAESVRAVCRAQNAREVRTAKDERERQLLWKGRKEAFGALGRLAPSYYTQDGVVPRTKIPATLQFIQQVAKKYGQRIGNVFHAGDGNMHPCVLFDPRDPEQTLRTRQAAQEIMEYCIAAGGSITGEHGVGMEKNNLMSRLFTTDDLEIMQRLRRAFDPESLLNPHKLFPTPSLCREAGIVDGRPA